MNAKIFSALQHLRPTFSIFLMPVYFLALSSTKEFDVNAAVASFIILHLLVYPASNGYNSLMDQDKGSIGGLKNPPPAPQILFPITLALDAVALILSFFFHPASSILLLGYISASRLYSWRGLRIKKYPITGFLWVVFFQGAMVYWFCLSMFHQELNIFSEFNSKHLIGMLLSSLMISSTYPLTQVYQHEQDKKDGITTISMLLGVRNTFRFSGLLILIFSAVLAYYLLIYERSLDLFVFLVLNIPASWHLVNWYKKVLVNENNADYNNTMKMSLAGAMGANLFFIYLTFRNIFEL